MTFFLQFWWFFLSLCLLGAILAKKENNFICKKKNVIFDTHGTPVASGCVRYIAKLIEKASYLSVLDLDNSWNCYCLCSKNARHNHANSLIQKALTTAEFAAIWEPKGLFATDKKRPDGITTFPYKGVKSLAWDFTVVDTVCAILFNLDEFWTKCVK